MIKTILVPASGDDRDSTGLAAALAVARVFAAHIDALHIRLDPIAAAVAMTTDAGGGALTEGLIDQLERDAQAGEARTRESFTRFCAGAGLAEVTAASRDASTPSAEWHVERGEERAWIAAYGLAADLIVMPRGTAADVAARAILEAALLETGRPVLIPAAAAMPAAFDRIAIAWKATAPAARAVAAAMPLLARAQEVVVLTVAEPDQTDDQSATRQLVRNLAWHGVKADSARLDPQPAGAAATLLAAASKRADLLVRGGYGHSRLREWVFGGFTRHVLADAPLPVLMVH